MGETMVAFVNDRCIECLRIYISRVDFLTFGSCGFAGKGGLLRIHW